MTYLLDFQQGGREEGNKEKKFLWMTNIWYDRSWEDKKPLYRLLFSLSKESEYC